jgi:potassium/hydrogen antiporter
MMGLIVFRIMKKVYSQQFSPVAIITTALLTYILAENLGGNGVLSVATLGLLFGNSYVKEKEVLQEFNSMLTSSLIILVFVLIGFIVAVEFSFWFMIKALVLFFVLVLTRLTAIQWSLKDKFSYPEKVFMALSMPKGIAVAVVAFTLSLMPLASPLLEGYMQTILQLVVICIIYSLIFSSVIDRFSYLLINVKIDDT